MNFKRGQLHDIVSGQIWKHRDINLLFSVVGVSIHPGHEGVSAFIDRASTGSTDECLAGAVNHHQGAQHTTVW